MTKKAKLMNKYIITVILVFTFVMTKAQDNLYNKSGLSLMETYKGYLSAVKNHNYNAVVSYFTNTNTLPFVSGSGEINLDMNQHLKGQMDWLNDSTWTYESELKSFQEYQNTGVIIEYIELHYVKNGEKSVYKVVATYVFRKENDEWRMVTDVCSAVL